MPERSVVDSLETVVVHRLLICDSDRYGSGIEAPKRSPTLLLFRVQGRGRDTEVGMADVTRASFRFTLRTWLPSDSPNRSSRILSDIWRRAQEPAPVWA